MAAHVLQSRRLVVVDIENVVGGVCRRDDEAAWARRTLGAAIRWAAGDQVVLGTSPAGLLHVGCGWPGARYVARPGRDGADLALLEVLEESVAARFGAVVVVSGDWRFAGAVASLTGQGVHVTVLAHPEALSARLALAASEVVHLGIDRRMSGAAA